MSAPTVRPGETIRKDPQAEKIYTFDWTDYCVDLGVTIDESAFAITGPDALLTYDNATVVIGGLKTQLRLKGGTRTRGEAYTVTNEITTSGTPAQKDDRSIRVVIVDL